MSGEGPRLLRRADAGSPVDRLWLALPAEWQGPVIGPGIEDWARICDHEERRLDLTGLPEQIARELAWMAHWQAADGTRSSVFAMNQLASILRRAIADHRPFPDSILGMDWDAASALQGWFYAVRWGRLPSRGVRGRLRIVFRFARLALLARCAGGPWWALDEWNPRCDPRIPLTGREPHAGWGGSPSRISQPWLREAAKWHLGTMLECGALRWSTVSQERMPSLARFSRHLAACFTDARGILGEPSAATGQAAVFARWAAGPANRSDGSRRPPEAVGPRVVNDDLRAVADLFAFVAGSPGEARRVLGPSPWDGITEAHAASWYRQVTRIPHQPVRTDTHYVDDHALAQILAALPLLGMPRSQQMTITRGDGTQVTPCGLNDPQAMRMILLQILTGRRASEARTCDHDCLSPVSGPAGENGEVTRFRYAQSKIDVAPDTILVDREVTAIIEEQQAWLRGNFPGFPRRHLFLQRTGNRHGSKPYAYGSYNWILREFSDLAGFTDSKGRPVRLSHTHRFRHSRLTRLAELGLPVHVLQRYAGHATPTMTLHYIAQREEHAEQAFLAAAKLKADGTRVTFSREDHDAIHLLGRADRILPNGWCLLPPLQSCGKGNACLTCAVFVTDHTHQQALRRQFTDTKALIDRARADFQERHGRPMPGDNVWLAQRQAEHDALARVLAAMDSSPDRAVQGAGCPSAPPSGPVPVTIDTRQPRKEQP
jgi:integrase